MVEVPRPVEVRRDISIHMGMLTNDGDGVGVPWVARARHDNAQLGKGHRHLVRDERMRIPNRRVTNRRRALVENDWKSHPLRRLMHQPSLSAERIEALVIRPQLDALEAELADRRLESMSMNLTASVACSGAARTVTSSCSVETFAIWRLLPRACTSGAYAARLPRRWMAKSSARMKVAMQISVRCNSG
jgi:hypothetical protein